MPIASLLNTALAKRADLIDQLSAQFSDSLKTDPSKTNCFRVFHGTVEGVNGLNIDRYGDAWLIQSFHQTLSEDEIDVIRKALLAVADLPIVYNDRSNKNSRILNQLDAETEAYARSEQVICENGVLYTSKLRHTGQDPLLFLDMRVGREFFKANSHKKSVLNLFAYTCGIGTAAAVGGAKRVVNVDFSSFALEAGRKNAELNGFETGADSVCQFIQSDAFPALRQLAGLKVTGRNPKKLPHYPKMSASQFDLVFLDPPRFAKSAFGTVDLINDYQSLFKPAVLATKPKGKIIACNNVAKVDRESWFNSLVRCVEKQGRSVSESSWLHCHHDFPSFDGNHPLKIVSLTIA
ncbi:class I SAM-dependent methyltransferase [Cocleimonas sp. KMM 6892]|uniref:class I SAM-dependent rRNA methyltransferase n=1 Tax=unclassified Cocleimonas TaxID=2639732 RepID=UPI002DBED143|nr:MULTISPECIES: class I SAM-dependent methyltransferase [unclassified Cocleimonas]MEB8434282.1 class I SAM-dependent methyltransferase [Cocleimonas sp. KMM 6892]MEC4717099.1 class I SAM-dependent methyltransferase [Cocleimonas sp. KMM 6895]MEC4746554.1 class I SAM-dependent methyltransferase [Cocleimonas sp. KMM 6896]